MSISKCTENQQQQRVQTCHRHGSQHVFRSRIRIGAVAQNHIAPPPGRTHSRHSCHAFHCRHPCTYHPRISSPLQHVASVQSWCIDELHVCDDKREFDVCCTKTSNLRTSERRPSTLAYKLARVSARATSASTCLFANRLHALASKDMCAKPMTQKIK